MNPINPKITKHVNDILQKYANSLFRNATLEFYGIETAPIKELINPELPVIEVTGGAADIVFLLEDDSYLHFAFNTGHNSIGAMVKCVAYDARLYERDKRKVHTVIIYTAEVKNKPKGLNIGTLVYNPEMILMAGYNGNTILAELESKIKAGQELTDADMLNLAMLPLMKHTIPRIDLAKKSIALAQNIPDATKRDACVAAAFAFASRGLSKTDTKKLLEVLKMFDDLATMLVESVSEEKAIEIAKKALRKDATIEFVKDITDLEESTIRRLRVEVDKELLGGSHQ